MEGKALTTIKAVSPAVRSGGHLGTSSAWGPRGSLVPAQSRTGCPCRNPAPTTHSAPCPHRPLPRLKDHLFFQRLENDGQEWLSSESDIWEPRARYDPEQETPARSTAELSAL